MFSSNTTQVSSGGYEIQRSLRFNSADSAYLNRTPASAGNRRTWTWSAWVKRGSLTTVSGLTFFNQGGVSSNYTLARFTVSGNLDFQSYGTSAFNFQKISTAVYRDLSAWYHIVFVLDATNTQARIYVNGEEVAYSTNVNPANTDQLFNQAALNRIGYTTDNLLPFDGYMTEVNFIDGQALTPSSFGAFDSQTGVWGPIRYAGSYGTNGFYLNFSNNSNTTAATLGADYSGNGNNWTPNNFSVSAGAGNDSLVDVPTNWGVDTGVGGSVRGNYCTLNPLTNTTGRYTVSNGNLQIVATNAFNAYVAATVSLPETGKYYFEYACTNTSGSSRRDSVGFVRNGLAQTYLGNSNTLGYDGFTGAVSGVATGSYATWDNGDIVGVAVDCDTGKVWVAKNNTWQNSGSPTGGTGQVATLTGITDWIPAVGAYAGTEFSYTTNGFTNFGQRPFAYTAPSGFRALNTQNLPTPTIGATPATQAGNYFAPTIYTGNGANNRTITTGLQSDFVWIKNRSNTTPHLLFDVIRGAGQTLYSNLTNAEVNNGTSYVQQFNSNNFLLGVVDGAVNGNGENYVSWVWRANGAGVTNTAGSITSTVSANTTSGFSVVTYSGNGFAGATVGHGLGAVPRMVIVKRRSGTADWTVYHASVGNTACLFLNLTNAASTTSTAWNDTTPTSSVFSLGTAVEVNGSTSTYVAYAFAEVPGYSRFGSYTGTGSSDGPFCFTGFRPAYVMVKRPNGADDWHVFDDQRDGFNAINDPLYPNANFAEGSGFVYVDLLSNGFKCRNNSFINNSGVPYIFAAFAEFPFKYSLAR